MGCDLYLDRSVDYDTRGPDPRIAQYAEKAHKASQELARARQEIDELKGAIVEHERAVRMLSVAHKGFARLLADCIPWRDEHTDKCFFCGDCDCGFRGTTECADRKRARRLTGAK